MKLVDCSSASVVLHEQYL